MEESIVRCLRRYLQISDKWQVTNKMGKTIGNLIVNGFTLWLVSQIVSGFYIKDLSSLIVGTVILAIVNTFLKPVLILFSLPISLLTLGLFIFIINALLLELVAFIVPGFTIANFWPTAILSAILLTIVSTFLNYFVKKT